MPLNCQCFPPFSVCNIFFIISWPLFGSSNHLLLFPGAVFTGYYQKNPPGVHFSMPVLLSLLWALLKAGMVCDVFSVLTVILAYNIVVSVAVIIFILQQMVWRSTADINAYVDLIPSSQPGHEFLLALYNFVREKGLMGLVPELIQLTFKVFTSYSVYSK